MKTEFAIAYCPIICEVCEKSFNLYQPELHNCDVSKLYKKIEEFVFQLNAEKVLNEQKQACQTGRVSKRASATLKKGTKTKRSTNKTNGKRTRV